MTEGERAGWWAVAYLLMIGAATYFTILAIIFSFIKKLFWGQKVNERIWDLFKQSGIDIGEDQESNIERFTELIVKECACIADDMKTLETARAIKEYFGVE